jgi:gliding motility-associated-like protein
MCTLKICRTEFDMNNNFTLRLIKTFAFLFISYFAAGQCNYNFPNGQNTVDLTPEDCSPQIFGGFTPGTMTQICGLDAATFYTFSFCDPGAGADFDSFITVYTDGGGSVIIFNDDACGLDSEVSFTYNGPAGGCVDVVIDAFPCNNTAGGTGNLSISCSEPGPNDCSGAEIICSSGGVAFNPSGPGVDDFQNPNNDAGCLSSDENQSAWYYFEIDEDAPANTVLEFTITPDGGGGEDYDFAVYGPDVPCDDLGSPLRCSYAAGGCAFCPDTGLGQGQTDQSENAGGNGYVAPIIVQPGQGFYLLVDNFLGNSTGFNLNWDGSAAPWLNCNPNCELEVSADTDGSYCAGDIVNISGTVITSNGNEAVQWTASPAIAITYLSSSNNPNSTVTIPDDATGTIIYTFTATEDGCEDSDDVIITILPPPPTNPATLEECADTDGNGTFDLTSLDVTVGSGNTVTWYDNPAGTPPAIADPTAYVSMGGTVYAVVTSTVDGCESEPQDVSLTIDVPDCDDGCQYTNDTIDVDCNCVNTPMPPVCDDNDCNTMDAYNDAICDCEFTPIPPPGCDDNDCNTLDTYNTTICICENTLIPPPDCDDNDCTTDDSYDAAICTCINTPIPPPDCDDNDCNTLDTYNTTTCMCENTPIPPPSCDDNDCTTDDSYDAATCNCINAPIPPPDCDDNDCNTLDTYNTTTCMCENTPIPPPSCDDNDCTTDDSYDAATCNCINTPIPPPDCDDNDCNTDDTYNMTTCMCENTPIPPPSCDDNDCNTLDTYNTTICICENTPIPPPGCDDNDCTTDDSYDAATCNCVNTPIPPPSCDDNDCNTLDTYNTTICICENTLIPPPDCDDNDCTTDDSYNAATCMCVNTPIPPPDCDDNDCNTLDTYTTTTCVCENTLIPPPDCDDNDCTTDDSYDAATCMCENTPIPPPDCDDNDCNTLDTYNTTTCMCENTPIPPPSCDDNDCNTLDTYNTTTCMCENTLIPPPDCNDGCTLTTDSYNSANCMCENMPPDPNDGCPLTIDSYDAANCQIINMPPDPDDGCPLTDDSFDAANCIIINTPPDPDDGCPLTNDSFDSANCVIINMPPDCNDGCALTIDTFDDPNCQCVNTPPDPDDGCALTDDIYDGANCVIINTPPDPDDGCPLTNDIWDGANCQIINTPPDCDDGCSLTTDIWDGVNCQCINTPPDPDDDCALTDDVYDGANCVIINTPPDPDDGCALTADSWDPVNCAIVNIPPNCNDGCQYTTDTFNDANCMCENILVVPDCDDNDCATTDSYDEPNCQCINVPILPPEVMDTSIDLCEEDNSMATFDLTTVEAFISNNSGTQIEWVNATGSPIGNPASYLTGTTTVNAFVYDNQSPACQSTSATIDLTVTPAPNSGDPLPPSTYCNNQSSPINLSFSLSGEQGGGVWAETSAIPTFGNAFNANAGTVTPSGVAPGIYTFSYTIPALGLCPSQVSEVTIIIEANPIVVLGTFSLTTCNTPAEGTFLNLQATIVFGDLTGSWSDLNGTGVDMSDPTNIDFDGIAPGLYLFAYTTAAAVSPCENDNYTLNVFVEDCGCPSVATVPAQGVCNDNGMIDLSSLEITVEEGFWTITSTPIGGNPATLTGDNFDASDADAGDYELTFTLEIFPGAACPETSSQIITVSAVPLPNEPSDQEECDLYILPVITGTDLSGNETYFTSTNGTGAMYMAGDEIDFTTSIYIFDDNGSCSSEISFDITINDTPELNNTGDQNVCVEYILSVITGANLSGSEGYYSQTGGMGTSYNAGDAITTSTEFFIYDANGSCSDEVSFMVNVELTPIVDDPGPQTSCGNFELPEITGTNLTGTVGYYSESGGTGTNYTVGSEISTNSTIYIYAINGACDDEVVFTVVLTSAPNAGTAEPAQIVCNDQTAAIFLETLITGEDPGGIWTETSAAGSIGGAFNPASGTFNPNNQAAGDYEFTYEFGESNCPPAESVVTVSISTPPSTEFSALVTNTCNVSAAGSIVDLTALLIGGDTGGIWTDNTGAVVTDPTSIDFDGQTEGTYNYQYTTNSAIAPCNDQSYDIEVVVEDCSCPSVATIPPNSDLCQDNGVLDLTTLLLTSEPGNWTITMTPLGGNPAVLQGNNFNASGADAGEYEVTFTLAVAPPTGCPDNSSQMIAVSALPQIDNPGTLVGCEEVLLSAITGTDLETAVYFAESGGGGASYNVGDAITENTTLFVLATNGACTNEISFNININQPPNPGTPASPVVACNDDNTSINLTDLLVDEAIGGTWTEISETVSTGTAFNAAAGTFNPETQVAGTYEFTYTVSGEAPCSEASATVSVSVETAPFTTFSATTVNVCNVAAQGSTVDLTALISGGDTSGTWTDNTGATVGMPENLDFNGATPSSLTYTYTTGGAVVPCENVSYEVEVVIEDCSCPSVTTSAPADLCNDAEMLDLTTLQITTELGIWTITNTPAGGNSATITGTTFDATSADAGVYELTFTLNTTPTPDCPPSSTQNITVSNLPNAGTGSATESCDTNESLIDLTDFLSGNDAGGLWSVNPISNAPNAGAFDATNATFNPLMHPTGIYVFDYTVNGIAPCPNASTSVTLTINPCECPSLELGVADPLCNDGGMTDLSALQITNEAGIWSITNSPAGASPAIIAGTTFDATSADAGIYELTFTIITTPSDGCPTTNSLEITVNTPPNAGSGGTLSQCNEDGIIDLTTLLSGSDIGGTWTLNTASAIPTAGAFDDTNATFDPTDNEVGMYLFDYMLNGVTPCPSTMTSITVNIVSCDCPSVELGTAMPICNDGGMIDLSTLQVTTEVGIWSITNSPTGTNSATLTGNNFDATSADAGIYELTFTLDTTPPAGCPASNAINIEVNALPIAGIGNSTTICEGDDIVTLNDLLTDNDAGGIWSLNGSSDTPNAGSFDASAGSFTLDENTEGAYTFDYTVEGQNDCPNAMASVTVNIIPCDCPSVELANAAPICNDETVDLSALQITTELGTWSIADAPAGSSVTISDATFNGNGTAAGTYTLQFTLNVNPPVDCPNSNSITLEVSASGNAGIADADYTLCNSLSETIDLFGELNGADTGGTWTETSTNASTGNAFSTTTGTFNMTGQTDGTYTFLYTVGNPTDICPIDAETVTVQITETPIANAGADMFIDCNITMVTLTGTSSSGEAVDFSWTNEEGQEIGTGSEVTIGEPGDFILTTGEDGCATSDSVTVTADQTAPDIDAGDDVTLDCDESTFVIEAIGDTGDEFTYDWTTDNGEIENPDILNPNVTDAGTYNIVVTNSINGCTSTDQIVISYLNGITGIDMLSQEPPCFEDQSGYIFVTNVQGGEQPINFNLNEEDLGETQAFTSLGAGSYELTLTDANGCTWDTLIIFEEYKELDLDLGENQFIEFGDAAIVEGNTNVFIIDTIIWEGPDSLAIECLSSDCLDVTASPTETVTLQATIIDANGCETTAFVTIVVRKEDNVFVPNVFSPNNDGENEFLYIFADESVLKINEFLVFDRWGETVHEYYQFFPNDPAFGWDGNHRGEPMNPQVLVWYAEVEFVDGRVEILKGDVTLVR